MPLNEQRLTNKIVAILDECQQENDNPNASKQNFASKLAKAIIEEIKEAKINYTTGLVAPSGGGPVTGTITHTIT
ncbi:hypothetical protein JJC03_15460 [Flavobacterium oreochromis]|uniref:hypothetical protein n=1 Tax=Flavobacterium oreochromis TaxID=2906078 RepID=UPI001CE6E855|nr:hypothetical protein [Flavobacterium oreochromis]QYS86303.1 hypothetical protein JJC03_15460 [Flavobacterium oreochromis]